MERVTLEVQQRDETGSRPARRLRKTGKIPGVLYGAGKPAVGLSVDEHALREALGTAAGLHAVIDLTVEGAKKVHTAVVKDYQLDHVRHVVTHIDFVEVKLNEPIESKVTVAFEGAAPGIKMGGIFDVILREVTVSALPTHMPEHLVVDVGMLEIGDAAHVGDLVVPADVTVLDDPEETLCSVLAPRLVVLTPEEEAAAAEAAEAAETAEPELVGERTAEEGDEGA